MRISLDQNLEEAYMDLLTKDDSKKSYFWWGVAALIVGGLACLALSSPRLF